MLVAPMLQEVQGLKSKRVFFLVLFLFPCLKKEKGQSVWELPLITLDILLENS